MSKVKSYLSLIRFSHTIFAMPFAMIGFFLGAFPIIVRQRTIAGFHTPSSVPGWHTIIYPFAFAHAEVDLSQVPETGWQIVFRLLLVVLCMIFARSAAMAFNRWLDVEFDARNPRTAIREIPRGIISKSSALRFVIFNCLAFIVCTWFINLLCFALSFVALAVVLGYSYTKRFTPLCHLILGLGLSLAPIGAYLALTGRFALLPVLFSFTVIFWVSGFDIIYALQDEEFDKSQQLYSMPSWLGKAKALRVSEFLHFLSMVCVVFAGYHGQFSWPYWVGVAIFIGMLIYQHAIVRPHDLSRVNLAFMTANGIASVVFAVFVIGSMYVFFLY
ncbi:UbiA-like polyprenyltransferase [Puia sp.]|jgi:4-hydroxybenzoate polyprenyltransferase|uniref:UbiA-like polyprenyltransferase n=1 Tax=Puia sp. TaxID=2045100 RepID=UPI002F42B22E